eukprot:COSAG06_NODE_5751_length_3293_cov_2.735128_4_plen_67_part_00
MVDVLTWNSLAWSTFFKPDPFTDVPGGPRRDASSAETRLHPMMHPKTEKRLLLPTVQFYCPEYDGA